ncbi:hypothetical protein SALBM311S_03599 [Streptomyces alboniger]
MPVSRNTTEAAVPAPASGTVHWIGTGLSTGPSGLRLLCDRAERVVLWDRSAERAADRLTALGLAGRAEVRALTDDALKDAVGAGDVIVSMLPAAEHPRLLRLALDRGAHFACTSYVSDALTEQAAAAADAGVVVLTEAGLDPGIDHLIARSGAELPRRVSWISRRRNYFPIDDSPFTNDYYMPDHSDYFYSLGTDVRAAFNAQHILTSDGISEFTLRDIYQRIYVHRFVEGNPDLVGLHPNREVVGVEADAAGGWDITVRHNDEPGAREHFEADVVVWATGFRPAAMDFLAPIADRLERDGDELRIDEDYAVRWDGPADRSIFVQNAARGQRGLADPNLSLNAWRSQRIADRLSGVRSDEQLASFIEWSTKSGTKIPWGA